MKYFIKDGKYIGAFDEGSLSKVPAGSIEVQKAPDDARNTWDAVNKNWIKTTKPNRPFDGDIIDALMMGDDVKLADLKAQYKAWKNAL
jgi:hypothetical protein